MNKIQIIVSVENRNIRVDIPINIYQSVNNDCNNGLKRKEFIDHSCDIIKERYTDLYSRPLKSPFLGDVVLTQYLANFLKHATKSFHGSFEVIDRSRQKNVHSISRHTLIKVAA